MAACDIRKPYSFVYLYVMLLSGFKFVMGFLLDVYFRIGNHHSQWMWINLDLRLEFSV